MLLRDRGWAFWRARPPFDEATLEDDVERVRRFYRSEGFYEADVQAQVEPRADGTQVDVTIAIARGEPILLSSLAVTWSGDGPYDLSPIVAALPFAVGEPFGARLYQTARDALLATLADRGHPLASLQGGARVMLEERSAEVEWSIDPGPLVRLGEVSIEGRERADEVLVRRALTVAPGDVFSPSALRAAERAVYATGVFRSVAARPIRPDEPDLTQPELVWPIELTVQERDRRSLRVGGGWGTEDKFRVRGEWIHRNVFGQAESFTVSGKYSSLILGAEARYRDPTWIEPDIELEIPLGFDRQTEPGYDVNRGYVGFVVSREIFEHWRISGGYRFEAANPTDIDTGPFENDEETVLMSKLPLRLSRSTVNNAVEPSRGTILEMAVRPTLSALGSDFDSVQITAGARGFLELHGVVLALRAVIGTIEPVLGTHNRDIPVFERFFAGGSSSNRGYDRHLLGPVDIDGDPLGGLTWLETSAELRFPIFRKFSGVAFVDAAQIRLEPHDWNLKDLLPAVGAGLRYRTPVGPIRFDIGVPLKDGRETSRYEIFFSVGHAF